MLHRRSFQLVSLLLLLGAAAVPTSFSSSASFSTFSISNLSRNTTVVCALLLASPDLLSPVDVVLNCTAVPSRKTRTYPSGRRQFAAVAAGDGFLCAMGPDLASPSSAGDTIMEWWAFTAGKEDPPKRLYRGPRLSALAAGAVSVCGLLSGGRLYCWRWSALDVPASDKFSSIAVGEGFVCGLARSSGKVRCFGNDTSAGVVGREPAGSYAKLAAAGQHACAISVDGKLCCWGASAPDVAGASNHRFTALAVGASCMCGMLVNGKVSCVGPGSSPPEDVAGEQFLAIEARGHAICGILAINFSLVCWGTNAFKGNHLLFGRVLPGPCMKMSSCSCGVLPGSADLCGDGGLICAPCPSSKVAATAVARQMMTTTLWVVLGVAGLAVCLAVALMLVLLWKGSRRRHTTAVACTRTPMVAGVSGKDLSSGGIEQFSFCVLQKVAEGFSDARRVGSGSFGSVYRAELPDGRLVAIKRAEPVPVSSSSSARPARQSQIESAFLAELTALSRANHRNVVHLLGFCSEPPGELVLVYEFLANGTLYEQLHKNVPLAPPLAGWHGRLKIALDAARGIEYMHAYAVPPIIHRDIKSSNILLDDAWTAKVADFGLSTVSSRGRRSNNDDGDVEESPFTAGTLGYMDPEYFRLQCLTEKSDVYSFGVMMLELLSGKKVVQRYEESVSPKNVSEFTVPHIVADDVGQILDRRLPSPTQTELEALSYVGYLAADCVRTVGRDRPTMSEVVDGLERAVALCATPPESRTGTSDSC